MKIEKRRVQTGIGAVPAIGGDIEADDVHPWEEIATGRYMPRRIRGSCRGRELG